MSVRVSLLLALCVATHAQSDEVAVMSVPSHDTEWYSLSVPADDSANANFHALDFDAASFVPSAAPYGVADSQNRWECPYNRLAKISPLSRGLWPANSNLLLRRMLDLPAGVSSLEVKITAHVSVEVWLNGQPVSGNGKEAKVTPGGLCAARDNVVFTIPDRNVRTGPNLLAVRVTGAPELNFFDMQVRTFYPRPVGEVGDVYLWGKGYYGVLGNGYETDSFTPGQILSLKELNSDPIRQVALGVSHTAMLTESGKVYAWGRGKEGQLGLSEEYSEVPLAVASLNSLGSMTAIAAGSLHTLALDSEGRVYCYGGNTQSQCGLSDEAPEPVVGEPRQVPIEEVVVLIGAKDTHSVAVTDGGRVYVWGRGVDREPRVAGTMGVVKQLAVGSDHVLLLDDEGRVHSYGKGEEGQLGIAETTQADSPMPVPSLEGVVVKQIAAGSDNSFAITDTGKVFVFGGGSFGKNGLGVWASQRTPIEVVTLGDHVIRRVGAGMTSTVFLTDKGEVFVSGANLRDGTHTLKPVFWASASDKYFADVFASHLHFGAMTRPSVWTWEKSDGFYKGTMAPDA